MSDDLITGFGHAEMRRAMELRYYESPLKIGREEKLKEVSVFKRF